MATPFTEAFEGATFVPVSWSLANPDGDVTWERTTTASSFGSGTASARMNNFSTDTRLRTDELVMPPLNLSGLTGPSLLFDVAYARYSATYSDSLSVFVSTDCGQTFSRVYYKGGTSLSTTGADQTTAFTPTAAQWRTETINLSSYTGQTRLIVKLVNRGGYGQYIYLDNVKVGTVPVAAFSASSVQVCAGGSVTFSSQSTGSPTAYSWSFPGGMPATSTALNPTVTYAAAGTYDASLTVSNSTGQSTLTKTAYINVAGQPAAPATTGASVCGSGPVVLTATGATGSEFYRWYTAPSGGNPLAGVSGGSYTTPSLSGTTMYYVAVANTAGCESDRTTVTATVLPVPTAILTPSGPLSFCEGGSVTLSVSTDIGTSYSWSNGASAAAITVGTAGNYTVTVSANGCSNAASAPVTVYQLPAVSAGADQAICEGATATLTASGATYYSWSTGATGNTISVSPSADASYTVTGTNGNGCSASATASVTVNSVPSVSVTLAPATIVAGATATLNATTSAAGASFSWSGAALSAATGASVTAAPAAAGSYTYTATATSTGGCTSEAAYAVLTVSAGCVTPSLPVVTATNICNGSGTATLSASGGGAGVSTYNWYTTSTASGSPVPFFTGSVYVTPVLTMSKAYYVTAVAGPGCESARKAVTANVTPAFTVSISPAAVTVSSGSSAALTATATTGSIVWKWSPAAGLNVTNAAVVMATPAATTTYTVMATRSTCAETATVIVNVACPDLLSGTYTINRLAPASAANFTSFSSLAGRLNGCGISGPVTIEVVPGTGPYIEQVEIGQVTGSSDVNTITLNGNGNVLQFAPASTVNYLLRLNGTDYFTLSNLTLASTSTLYGWGVHLLNEADHNLIQGCTFNLPATSTAGSLAGIVASNSTGSAITAGMAATDLQVLDNTINGGYYGISICGDVNVKAAGIRVLGNRLNATYYYGMYLLNLDAAQVNGNTVQMRSGNINSYGLFLNNIEYGFSLQDNVLTGYGRYGFYLNNCNSLSGTVRARISNNMIGGGVQSSTVAAHGLFLSNTDRADIWHNSVLADNGAAGTAACYVLSSSAGLDVRNNSFAFTGTAAGYAFYGLSASFSSLNYNNYYNTGSKFVFLSADRADLAALKAVIAPAGHDQQSHQGNPGYLSATDLHINPASMQLANRGVMIAAISTDIDGHFRGSSPDIGADEFALAARLAGSSLTTATLQLEAYPNPFRHEVTLRIKGESQEPVVVKVLDAMGREVFRTQLSAEAARQYALSLPAALAPGVYLLLVQQQEQTSRTKLIKE